MVKLAGARGRLARLASERLLKGSPGTCDRIENDVLAAIKKAEWRRARGLLQLRLRMKLAPDAQTRATIERILGLIAEAEAKGVGPIPWLAKPPV